jgi:AraC-like DNA-binding protein
MSDDLGISISYISRYFKEQTGQTVLDYVNYLRIDHAKQLLETTDEPIENVIKSIGYFDVSSFIRKFKKDMGITPGEYRKIHRV